MPRQDLEILIRARYPLLFVVSWEEQRVEEALAAVAAAQGKRLLVWTSTQGLVEPHKAADPAAKEPLAALDAAARLDGPALILLKDLHAHLQDSRVVRRLRDLVAGFKSTYKTLIILSPVLNLPPELEKEATVVDYPLPTSEELRSLLEDVVSAASRGGKFAVSLRDGDREKLVQSLQGLTLAEAENTLARAIVEDGRLSVEAVRVVHEEIKQILRKSRTLEYFEPADALPAVGGLEVLKDWLLKRGKSFSEQARRFGLPQPKGVLLLGVQGCGKSLTCKTIAGLWGLPLLRLDMGSLFGSLVGQSEDNMRRAIKTAEAVAPCVLWIDEIEKAMSGVGSSNMSDSGTTARVFSTFLTWLQEKTKPVFVAATANDISALPPELLRKGRLDEIFFVDLPGQKEREEILGIHLKRRGRDPAVFDLAGLSAAADGFSGAELEQLIIEGLSEAFLQGRELSQLDLARAAGASVPLSRTMREDIERLRKWASTRARPASRLEAAARRHP